MRLLSIVVPLKDEEANVGPLVERVRDALQELSAWELILVDDGSTDGTFTKLAAAAAADPRIKIVRLRRNFGQSAATQAGLDAASGDIIITMDGDLQNDPADIPRLVARLDEGFDAVLGQRMNRQDKLLLRKLPSLCANWLIRKVLGVPFKDFGCTLRAMRREVTQDLVLYGEMHRFITAIAGDLGAAVTEIPVNHRPRLRGQSKYGISRTVRVVLDLLTIKFLSGYSTRPIHVFGTFGLVTMMTGLLITGILGLQKIFFGVELAGRPLLLLGVLLLLGGVQLVTLGLLGEMLARTYHESQAKPIYRVREVRVAAAPASHPGASTA
jgi:glycosyltransferase involved in cell wall biosynthesis